MVPIVAEMLLLGGVISSTAITLGFARYSRQFPALAAALATGEIGACTILVPRVLVVSGALNPDVAKGLVAGGLLLVMAAAIAATLAFL